MRISRLTRKEVDVLVSATLKAGGPATITGVDVALMEPKIVPNAGTVWLAADYESGVATVLLAGPDADDTNAIVVPEEGGDLWIRVAFGSEVEVARVERIVLT
jgi:hypothetical protein